MFVLILISVVRNQVKLYNNIFHFNIKFRFPFLSFSPSKNAQQQQSHRQHQHRHSASKERSSKDSEHRQRRTSKRDEALATAQEHVYGLKSAIIKTTTKLREKSRARKERK